MTKLTYVVAGKEFTSYLDAVRESTEHKAPITRRYQSIEKDLDTLFPQYRKAVN